ncbi:MAG: DNA replication/repair protein RecF [Acidocella sp.]|nr:DNA replication/repair protein RecF [Acidocella sp.]
MAASQTHITRITLTDFRSYAALRFNPTAPVNVFTGPNGAGKTNLLEAVSLLVPGRGLRGVKFSELIRRGPDAGPGWAVAAQLSGGAGPFEIGTGTPPDDAPDRRVFRLDGDRPRAQGEVAARLAAVWLTPQMDRLFSDAASGRRRFLDRLVVALEPGHAREVAGFEAASAQRTRLLATQADPGWLAALEDAMARHAVAATAARLALLAQLNATLGSGVADPFPRVGLALGCPIAARLTEMPALAAEDELRAAYHATRAQDALRGSTASGPNRADLLITDAASARPAGLSSTGQQKAMLIGIVLGHAALIAAQRGTAPLLLLDEPLVHLDARHRVALFAALARLNLAAWLTGTDAAPFAGLDAACHDVHDSHIEMR